MQLVLLGDWPCDNGVTTFRRRESFEPYNPIMQLTYFSKGLNVDIMNINVVHDKYVFLKETACIRNRWMIESSNEYFRVFLLC
jgi:hypothetical protein